MPYNPMLIEVLIPLTRPMYMKPTHRSSPSFSLSGLPIRLYSLTNLAAGSRLLRLLPNARWARMLTHFTSFQSQLLNLRSSSAVGS